MANRLQLKRGTGAPGSIFYEGEPIFDLGSKALYVGDTGAAGSGAGTSIASAETFLASLQILTRATTASAGAINLYEDADNGTNKVQLIAPTSLSSDVTLTLPTADGNSGDVIVTDGSGNLSFTGVVTSFVFSGDTGEDIYQSQAGGLLFEGGEGIDTAVTDNKLTITAEAGSATNAGIASYQSSQFYFENTYTVGVVTATTTAKGIASFNADDFDVITGEVTLEDTVLKTVTTDSGALTPSGHSLSILGGEGLDVTHAGATITIDGEDASDTNKGIASFSSQYFTVSSGNVTIADSSVGVVTAISGTANEVQVSRSNGSVTVGLTTNVTIAGDLRINGGDILSGAGTTTITLSGNDATFADNVTVTGSLKVDDIQSEGGLSAISITTSGDPATTTVNIYEDFAVTGFSYFTQAIYVDTNVFALGNVFTNNIGAYDETSAITIEDGTGNVGITTNLTVGNDLTVNGNLRVVGTAVTFETETVRVEDRLIELGLVSGAAPSSATTWDTGVAFNYFQTSAKKSGIIWLNNQFMAMLSELSDGGGTDNDSPQITATAYAPIVADSLYLGGITAGDEVINSSKEAVNLIFDGGTYS